MKSHQNDGINGEIAVVPRSWDYLSKTLHSYIK